MKEIGRGTETRVVEIVCWLQEGTRMLSAMRRRAGGRGSPLEGRKGNARGGEKVV